MRVDPVIAALRSDPSPQARAQAVMVAVRDGWRSEARVAPVLDELEIYGAGAPLEACPALAALFAEPSAAEEFAAGLCTRFANELRERALGQLPFRHSFDGVLSTLLLARKGRARLTLVAQEPGEYQTGSAAFSDVARHDAVIAGQGAGRLTTRLADGGFEHRRVRLAPGAAVMLDLSCEGLFVERIERRLVTLRLYRAAPQPGPVREYALEDSRLIQTSAGDISHSRQEMMLALLGRMKRREAVPLLAAIAGEDGPDSLRWEALREALALDTGEGFAALCKVARAPLDPLATAAGALRAQLIEAHPELRAFEEAQCRG